ncbi:MAG: patatin-like phospholipase family protein [Hyphomicrobiales bacterium]|nr:patatin-like phospholipase family protein [Hyphomicrobiales bacterium]
MLTLMRRAQAIWNDESGAAPPAPVDRPAQNHTPPSPRRPKIGLALGAGAARGWCHIGILRELDAAGFRPDVIAGTSIGALVGGCFAAGKLDAIEDFALSLTRRRVLGLLDLSFSGGGLFSGARLRDLLSEALAGVTIESLPVPFAAVATEISTGHEIWLRNGLLSRALPASYALPGLLEPQAIDGRWLFDGALVNPIPVSVCRALGADIVVAISLQSDSMFRGTVIGDRNIGDETTDALAKKVAEAGHISWLSSMTSPTALIRRTLRRGAHDSPGVASVMLDAFSITQDRIARSRLAGDPPDVLINARLEQFGLFDFHRARELIAVGRETARRKLPEIIEHASLVAPA